jgi:hypothetical protein
MSTLDDRAVHRSAPGTSVICGIGTEQTAPLVACCFILGSSNIGSLGCFSTPGSS